MNEFQPPRLAERFLRWWLPRGVVGDSILGDAREEFAEQMRSGGRLRSALWYWLHALKIAVHYVWNPSVLVLALGIGLSTFMFSVVYGVFFRGMGVPEEDRVMMVYRTDVTAPPDNTSSWSIQDYADIAARESSFETLAAYSTGTVNVAGSEAPTRYNGVFATAGLFDVLRVQPVTGRTFAPEEDDPGAPLTVVLGYRAWRNRYGGSPDVIGQVLRVNGEQGTVIGVMPEGFLFPQNHEIYVALRDDPLATERWQGRFVTTIGRLRAGVEWDQAALDVASIARQLEQEYPETNEGMGAVSQTFVQASTGRPLVILFGYGPATRGVGPRAAVSVREHPCRSRAAVHKIGDGEIGV